MAFTHVQGVFSHAASGTSATITLSTNPVAGNVVTVGVYFTQVVSGVTLADANSNSYLVTPNSGVAIPGLPNNVVYLFYLAQAPSNASKTLNLSWTTSAASDAWAEEFAPSSGRVAVFDMDIAGTGTTGTTINTPTITPRGINELMWSTAVPGGGITAPAADAILGQWTGAHGGIAGGSGASSEYALNVSSPLAVQYTQSSAPWAAMGMAFVLAGDDVMQMFDLTPGSCNAWDDK